MWGLRPPVRQKCLALRFIPTYVGLTGRRSKVKCATSVHPHVCGAYTHGLFPAALPAGSSPRMWGLPFLPARRRRNTRFIPTYVGLTVARSAASMAVAVHPHVCGAYDRRNSDSAAQRRFIPTYVGLTSRTALITTTTAVHPHVCGAYSIKVGRARSVSRFIPTYVGLTCVIR